MNLIRIKGHSGAACLISPRQRQEKRIMEIYQMRVAALLAAAPFMLGFTESPLVDDPAAGERLAVRWCSGCHLVQPSQTRAHSDVPSFLAIARNPDFKAENIVTFLITSHPKMPSYSLSRIEARVIASYLESLAKPVP
jgi:mono/diheme cytochrome c family protein